MFISLPSSINMSASASLSYHHWRSMTFHASNSGEGSCDKDIQGQTCEAHSPAMHAAASIPFNTSVHTLQGELMAQTKVYLGYITNISNWEAKDLSLDFLSISLEDICLLNRISKYIYSYGKISTNPPVCVLDI